MDWPVVNIESNFVGISIFYRLDILQGHVDIFYHSFSQIVILEGPVQ